MPSGESWITIQPLNPLHQSQLKQTFPAGIERMFWDNADIPQKKSSETWPGFIERFVSLIINSTGYILLLLSIKVMLLLLVSMIAISLKSAIKDAIELSIKVRYLRC